MTAIHNHHLDCLETELIYIIREMIVKAKKPALLFSGSKGSVVLLMDDKCPRLQWKSVSALAISNDTNFL